MKKFLFISLLFATGFHLHAQEPLDYILKKYFRAHPFDTRFSTFITNLQHDPWFKMEHYIRRTDSNFFFLSGIYSNFQPFGFPAKEIKLVVAEYEYIYQDSLLTIDTIINLQMMGLTDTSSVNIKELEKDFNKFYNRVALRFSKLNCRPVIKGRDDAGRICDFFVFPTETPSVTAVWGKLEETNQLTFTIIIRCRISENTARIYLGRGF